MEDTLNVQLPPSSDGNGSNDNNNNSLSKLWWFTQFISSKLVIARLCHRWMNSLSFTPENLQLELLFTNCGTQRRTNTNSDAEVYFDRSKRHVVFVRVVSQVVQQVRSRICWRSQRAGAVWEDAAKPKSVTVPKFSDTQNYTEGRYVLIQLLVPWQCRSCLFCHKTAHKITFWHHVIWLQQQKTLNFWKRLKAAIGSHEDNTKGINLTSDQKCLVKCQSLKI